MLELNAAVRKLGLMSEPFLLHQFLNSIIQNALGGIIATAVIALCTYLWSAKFRTFIRRRLRGNHFTRSKKYIISEVLLFLEEDQDTSGVHKGQFGRSASAADEAKYQTGNERLDIKPRLYLTGWPVFVLTKHRFAKRSVRNMLAAALEGVRALVDSGWVRVGMGASQFTSPLEPNTEISYRHTIRAAQILQALEGDLSLIRSVLGHMLDSACDMQTNDGGWRQCDGRHNEHHRREDLWASAYAVGFLFRCASDATRLDVSKSVLSSIQNALERTMAWLTQQWHANKWQYGGASSEENQTLVFHECSEAFNTYDAGFSRTFIAGCDAWLDPIGHPKPSHLAKCGNEYSGAIRLCYAYFVARSVSTSVESQFATLFDWLRGQRFGRCNSAEAAMLLDMLLVTELPV
jgi:hypothetical protein